MSSLAISRRYARALFELRAEGTDVSSGLEALAAVAAVPVMEEFLDNPQMPAENKVAAVDKAVGGKLSDELKRLVALLAGRGKASLLPEINAVFAEMVREAEDQVVATVTVAAKLDAESKKKVEAAVAKVAGKKVQLNVVEDKQILGGMVVSIGDRQIDCSLRGKLEGLRKAIAA